MEEILNRFLRSIFIFVAAPVALFFVPLRVTAQPFLNQPSAGAFSPGPFLHQGGIYTEENDDSVLVFCRMGQFGQELRKISFRAIRSKEEPLINSSDLNVALILDYGSLTLKQGEDLLEGHTHVDGLFTSKSIGHFEIHCSFGDE